MQRSLRAGLVVAAGAMVAALGPGMPAPASALVAAQVVGSGVGSAPVSAGVAPGAWVWPVEGPYRLVETFVAPAHDYAPGHRGIDIEPLEGGAVRAPADGIVAFSGQVAGRGVITIDHGDGLVTTLEPVESALTGGTAVVRADVVGDVSVGGHAAPGAFHFGVRLDGRYINPMLLLGGVPRAVLVPCCDPL